MGIFRSPLAANLARWPPNPPERTLAATIIYGIDWSRAIAEPRQESVAATTTALSRHSASCHCSKTHKTEPFDPGIYKDDAKYIDVPPASG